MKLNYKIYGEGDPLLILHGLFGSLDNWQSLSKRFGEHCQVIAVDLRNHGHSPHFDEMDYRSMAGDVAELMDDLKLEQADILGHSMGGKTAMKFAMDHPTRVRRLIVADIAPRAYDHHHSQVLAALFALENAEILDSRKMADALVSEHIDEVGVRLFLLKNLYWKEKGRLKLRVNLEVIAEHMGEVLADVGDGVVTVPTLFLRGEKSDYINDADALGISHQFPDSQLHTIADAGHWLHAEQQDMFYDEVATFLEF